jgi:hypothetical protein
VTTDEIIGSIDGKLQILADEIDTLEAARAALALEHADPKPAAAAVINGTIPSERGVRLAGSPAPKPRVEKPQVEKPRVEKRRVEKPQIEKPGLETPRVEAQVQKPGAAESLASKPAAGKLSRRRGPRPAPLTAEHVLSLLGAGDELTTVAIAERAGRDRELVLGLLRELESAGKVRRIGEKRGTRWRAFTEEDWIAQRAAELAARSRRAA